MLCTTDLHCTQCRLVLIRWCTRRFCMFVISSVHDGAQYNVVRLAVCHRSPLCTMVHNTAWWCTTQVSGAQCSPVPTRWCTTKVSQTYTCRQTDMTNSITFDSWHKRGKLLEMLHLEIMFMVSVVAKNRRTWK